MTEGSTCVSQASRSICWDDCFLLSLPSEKLHDRFVGMYLVPSVMLLTMHQTHIHQPPGLMKVMHWMAVIHLYRCNVCRY